jgi:hypothetical protein
MKLNDILLNGFWVAVMVACATIAIRLVVFCVYGAIKHLNHRGGGRLSRSVRYRILAEDDDALRKGSFLKINYAPLWKQGVSIFLNGKYLGQGRHVALNPRKAVQNLQQVEDFAAARLAEGYRAYTWQEFKLLAPPNIL